MLDPQEYARARYREAQAALAWKPGTPAEMRDWQRRLRARLRSAIGAVPESRGPLEARTGEVREFPRYRRETVRFMSRPGLEVFGYYLLPRDVDSPRPGVVCLPGHGRGVDSIVGIAADGSQRDLGAPDEYQADFALQCVAHGYPTLAIEQVSFGHRRDRVARELGPDASSCVRDSMAALMLGETVTAWRVHDTRRALDYLSARPEVDSRWLITMGISGGGLTSFWTACLDTRVWTAVVSGYFNTFRGSILTADHCVDNVMPNLLHIAEMPDMAGLIAPRGFFIESGTDDPIFPLATTRQAVEQAEAIYRAFGVPERFGYEIFQGDHRFHGRGAFSFLKRRVESA